ncbi:MAG: HYR domain-containing protein [Gammaproteobacteria bacterium]
MRLSISLARRLGVLAILFSATASAQITQGVPAENVNVIGPTPAGSLFFPDNGIRQQNEPSCGIKPGSPLEVICAFNDYRGAADARVGDAWQGVAESHNGGKSWISRLIPGWKGYGLPDQPALQQYALGMDFAADPTVVIAPGVMLLNFIAAERDENGVGGIYVQRWHEVNNEAGFNWQPEPESRLIDAGTAGRFIDKPYMMLNLLPPGSGTVTVSGMLEDGSPSSVQVPAGEVTVAYAVFVGSQENGTKVLVSQTSDYGNTWSNPTKLTETLNLNQGVSLSAMGNKMIAVWRQVADSNNGHNIAYALSNDRGNKWGKAKVLADSFCPFDQTTSVGSFRTTSFPVITNDGNNFQVFFAARGFAPEAGDNSCANGAARIVMSTSATGNNWSAPVAIDPVDDGEPTANPDAHQFMPAVATARGRTQAIWYDTRFDVADSPAPFVADSFDAELNRYRLRTAAVRGIQIIDGSVPASSVQVSRYQTGIANDGEGLVQLENNFLNMRLFANGQIPFVGDYIWAAAENYRLDNNGDWVTNTASVSGEINDVSFLAAWADNRNVRGNVWGDISAATPTPYSSSAAPLQSEIDDTIPLPCLPGGGLTGTRAADVYSSVIEPGVVLASPAPIKQLGGLVPQRAYVLTLANNTSADVVYDLEIVESPPGARVSFSQFVLTDGPEPLVQIPVALVANSSAVRTLYINSDQQLPRVRVVVKQGAQLLDDVLINGNPLAPTVQDPDGNILGAEEYDPFIVNKVVASYSNPNLQNPNFQNPNLQNPNFQNPNYQNPNSQNPNLQNPNYQNPNLQNPNLQNPNLQNVTVQYPNLQNPNLQNSAFEDEDTYTDITWEVTNTGNTTTGYDVSAFSSINTEGMDAQFFASRTYATTTVTNDCQVAPIAQNQVLFTIQNPNLQNPNLQNPNLQNSAFTDGSVFMAPGETLHFTLRVPGIQQPEDPIGQQEFADQFGLIVLAQPLDPEVVFDIDDPLGPIITGPSPDVTEEATGPLTPVSFEVNAIDFFDGPVTPVCVPASGSDFGLGATPVVCTATDSNGNESTLAFDVIVTDTTPPQITSAPGNQTLEATSPAGAIAVFDFQATDVVDAVPSLSCDAMSGSTFPIGVTPVSCTATDSSGNSSVAMFSITVQDSIAPVITAAPPDATVEASSAAGATVSWVFMAVDNADPAPALSCTPAQGVFAIGTTPVVCTATDASGNSSSIGFQVTVQDTTPPEFLGLPLADISVPADLPAGAVVTYAQPAAQDLVDNYVTVTCLPASGSTFPLGDTPVSCTAMDDTGNTAIAGFLVSVTDGTAPVISFASDPLVAFADSLLGAVVDFSGNISIDDVDPSPTLDCSPVSGSQFGFGSTSIACTATDASGNVGSGSFEVVVQYLPLSGLDNNFPKPGVKVGSSVGLTWSYGAPDGSILGSGDIFPLIMASGPLPGVNNCNSFVGPDDPPGTPIVLRVEDPGDSRLRYQDPSWRFNWQTVDETGANLAAGCYNIRLGAYARDPTLFPGETPIQIDGPFTVKLK